MVCKCYMHLFVFPFISINKRLLLLSFGLFIDSWMISFPAFPVCLNINHDCQAKLRNIIQFTTTLTELTLSGARSFKRRLAPVCDVNFAQRTGVLIPALYV